MAFSPKIAPLERFCLRHGSKPHAGEGKLEPKLQSGPSPACGGRWRALARRKGAAACAGAWGTPLHHADACSPPFEHSSHGLLTPASAGAGSKIAPLERFCLRHGPKPRAGEGKLEPKLPTARLARLRRRADGRGGSGRLFSRSCRASAGRFRRCWRRGCRRRAGGRPRRCGSGGRDPGRWAASPSWS